MGGTRAMGAPLTDYPLLEQILPSAYEYVVCEFIGPGKAGGNNLNKDQFKASFHLKLRNKLEVKFWIKDFEKISALKWQVSRTYVGCGSKGTESVYQVDLKCHHMTVSRSVPMNGNTSRDTCCPAKLSVVVKHTPRTPGELSWSADQCSQQFPTYIYLDFRHNHPLPLPDSLEKEDLSEKIVQKLTELYKAGHTPLTALEVVRCDLQRDYAFMAGDRKFPDKQVCYRVFYNMFSSKASGDPSNKDLLEDTDNNPLGKPQYRRMSTNIHDKLSDKLLHKKMLVECNKTSGLKKFDESHEQPSKNNFIDFHCTLSSNPLDRKRLVNQMKESGGKVLVDCDRSLGKLSSKDIFVDIKQEPSSKNLLVNPDERLGNFCSKYHVLDTDIKSLDVKMLVDLEEQLGTFCRKYQLHCTRIEKTENKAIIAVCAPVTKVKRDESSEDNQKNYSPMLQDLPSIKFENVLNCVQSQENTDSSAIRQCIESTKLIFDDLLSKVEHSPDVFFKPVTVFLKNFHKIQKGSDLISALHTFGKNSSLRMAVSKTLKQLYLPDPVKDQQSSALFSKKRKGAHLQVYTTQSAVDQAQPQLKQHKPDAEVSPQTVPP